MKTVSNALHNFLPTLGFSAQAFICDLYELTVIDGSVFRYSDRYALTFGGNFYPLAAIGRVGQKSKGGRGGSFSLRSGVGLSVDDLKFVWTLGPGDHINGTPILQLWQQGFFDGASVKVTRLIMSSDPNVAVDTSMGGVVLWYGFVADVETDTISVTVTVKSRLEDLNAMAPQRLYSPSCTHILFDPGCGLNIASFTFTGAAQSGSDTGTVKTNLSGTAYPGPLAGPAAAPTLSVTTPSSGVNLPPIIYFVRLTYVNSQGESVPSPEASISAGQGQLLHVDPPPSSPQATGYNVYVGAAAGDEQLQPVDFHNNPTPYPLGGSGWDEPGFGLSANYAPPLIAQSGYFALGSIKFTSGQNAGITRYINQHLIDSISGDANLVVIPPLPFVPLNGDAIVCVPGCDRTVQTCKNKFNNLINIAAEPWIPDPLTSL